MPKRRLRSKATVLAVLLTLLLGVDSSLPGGGFGAGSNPQLAAQRHAEWQRYQQAQQQHSSRRSDEGETQQSSHRSVAPAPLPEGWSELFTGDPPRPYYVHNQTRKTQWERPVEPPPPHHDGQLEALSKVDEDIGEQDEQEGRQEEQQNKGGEQETSVSVSDVEEESEEKATPLPELIDYTKHSQSAGDERSIDGSLNAAGEFSLHGRPEERPSEPHMPPSRWVEPHSQQSQQGSEIREDSRWASNGPSAQQRMQTGAMERGQPMQPSRWTSAPHHQAPQLRTEEHRPVLPPRQEEERDSVDEYNVPPKVVQPPHHQPQYPGQPIDSASRPAWQSPQSPPRQSQQPEDDRHVPARREPPPADPQSPWVRQPQQREEPPANLPPPSPWLRPNGEWQQQPAPSQFGQPDRFSPPGAQNYPPQRPPAMERQPPVQRPPGSPGPQYRPVFGGQQPQRQGPPGGPPSPPMNDFQRPPMGQQDRPPGVQPHQQQMRQPPLPFGQPPPSPQRQQQYPPQQPPGYQSQYPGQYSSQGGQPSQQQRDYYSSQEQGFRQPLYDEYGRPLPPQEYEGAVVPYGYGEQRSVKETGMGLLRGAWGRVLLGTGRSRELLASAKEKISTGAAAASMSIAEATYSVAESAKRATSRVSSAVVGLLEPGANQLSGPYGYDGEYGPPGGGDRYGSEDEWRQPQGGAYGQEGGRWAQNGQLGGYGGDRGGTWQGQDSQYGMGQPPPQRYGQAPVGVPPPQQQQYSSSPSRYNAQQGPPAPRPLDPTQQQGQYGAPPPQIQQYRAGMPPPAQFGGASQQPQQGDAPTQPWPARPPAQQQPYPQGPPQQWQR